MKHDTLRHDFVEYIPSTLEDGILYVSIPFATVVHKCCCGCGNEVVTPLSPTDWTLSFDGRSVSLDPSIGNWSFACQSHYWIRNSRVIAAPRWSRERIQAGRARDSLTKERYFAGIEPAPATQVTASPPSQEQPTPDETWWTRLKKRWF